MTGKDLTLDVQKVVPRHMSIALSNIYSRPPQYQLFSYCLTCLSTEFVSPFLHKIKQVSQIGISNDSIGLIPV